jgi:glycolate dehydrogenase FAD-binding subunit
MTTSTRTAQGLLDAVGPLAGGHARLAGDGDVVAGVSPKVALEPAGEDEIAAVLAFADGEGLQVVVRGGGTQLGLGYPPRGADILLSTARLAKVVEYSPHDLTVTVEAGMPLRALQETLAPSRQWLALDPDVSDAATIGGIVATNATGASRLRYGGVRDQIIGIRVVTADGTVAKGGGKVVKNVAGYDLPKLFTGSLGTLGVIVAASFRLYPLPEASRTVVLTARDPEPLCDLAVRVMGTTLTPSILDVMGTADGEDTYTCATRFESLREACDNQAQRLIELAGELGATARTVEGDDETHFWRDARESRPPRDKGSAITIKVSLLPVDVAGWLADLRKTAAAAGVSARWRAHAGHGLIFAHLDGEDAPLGEVVEQLRQAALAHDGSLVVIDAPPALSEHMDVWGPSAALEVMRRLKASFDPKVTLNPGRFIGRI